MADDGNHLRCYVPRGLRAGAIIAVPGGCVEGGHDGRMGSDHGSRHKGG